MEHVLLVSLGGIAVFWDLWKGKIPNPLIAAGLCSGWCFQLGDKGIYGLLHFLGGSVLPLLLFAALYYFRMFGAGDIKLFSVLGGILGVRQILRCIVVALCIGAIISLCVILKRGVLKKRLNYFIAYFSNYFLSKKWIPYRTEKDKQGQIHFSIPVFISILFYVGGAY